MARCYQAVSGFSRTPARYAGASALRRKSTIAPVGAPGVKTSATPRRLSSSASSAGNRPADDDEHVAGVVRAESLYDPRHQRHVRPRENRDPHRVRVLLDRRLDDLLGCLVEARVDDLHARVPQRPRDDLRPPVVAVEPRLRDHDPNRPLHAVSIGTCVSSSSGRHRPGRTREGRTPGTSSSPAATGCCSTAGLACSARLRESEQWPTVEAIAITHFHLDHWGDLVPWVWGSFYRRGHGDLRPELWVYRGGKTFLEELGSRLGFPDMFERTFVLREYDAETPFSTAAGLEVLPVRLPHYRLETYGFRVTNGEATLAYTGDTGPSERIAELAHDADLFVCEATLETGEADGEPRGQARSKRHCRSAARRAGRASGYPGRPAPGRRPSRPTAADPVDPVDDATAFDEANSSTDGTGDDDGRRSGL